MCALGISNGYFSFWIPFLSYQILDSNQFSNPWPENIKFKWQYSRALLHFQFQHSPIWWWTLFWQSHALWSQSVMKNKAFQLAVNLEIQKALETQTLCLSIWSVMSREFTSSERMAYSVMSLVRAVRGKMATWYPLLHPCLLLSFLVRVSTPPQLFWRKTNLCPLNTYHPLVCEKKIYIWISRIKQKEMGSKKRKKQKCTAVAEENRGSCIPLCLKLLPLSH